MFRRTRQSLPKDPVYEADLEKLGYFVNALDQIRKIEYPNDRFQYHITSNNERHNEAQREAMHKCIRKDIIQRFRALGVQPLYFPHFATEPSSRFASQPILCTPAKLLRKKKAIILIVNSGSEDLGVLSYREICHDGGISNGSMISLVGAALAASNSGERVEENSGDALDAPGIIILNPGQRFYSYKHAQAMTQTSWLALPRASGAHPPPKVDASYNYVANNRTAEAHIMFAFNALLNNPDFVAVDARLYAIGICDGGDALVDVLADIPAQLGRVAALALAGPPPLPYYTEAQSTTMFRRSNGKPMPSDLPRFISRRARAWIPSHYPLDTALANPAPATAETPQIPCPMLSGGSEQYGECILPTAYRSVLAWFAEVANSDAALVDEQVGEKDSTKGVSFLEVGYANTYLQIPQAVLDDRAEAAAEVAAANAPWE